MMAVDLESEVRQPSEEITPISRGLRGRIIKLLNEYASIFKEELDAETEPVGNEMKIEIKEGEKLPSPQRMRRRSQKEEETIAEWIKKMLKHGFIEKANHVEHAAQLVVVQRNGKERICVDFRRLNEVTVKDIFPQRCADDILASFHGAKILSTMDATAGFHQITIAPASRDLTAFKVMNGCYRFIRMPFGLVNAPATFNSWLDEVFRGIEVQRYVDDLIVASRSEDDHIRQLRNVFERCKTHGVKLKPSKCNFGCYECKVLGFLVSARGIRADPAKVQAIISYGTPCNRKELETFLGMVGFYRRFVRMLAAEDLHLREVSKRKPFVWTEAAAKEFAKIKEEMAAETILTHPDMKKKFYVHCDASAYAIGAILLQEDDDGKLRVIEFYSRKLNSFERNYGISEKEGLALVSAVERWHHYLHGSEFSAITDHKPLLQLSKSTQPRLTRWRLRLSQYAFTIHWRSGKNHLAPDAMSRDPRLMLMKVDVEKQDKQEEGAYQRWGNENAEVLVREQDLEHIKHMRAIDSQTKENEGEGWHDEPLREHKEQLYHFREHRRFLQAAKEKELRDKLIAERDRRRSLAENKAEEAAARVPIIETTLFVKKARRRKAPVRKERRAVVNNQDEKATEVVPVAQLEENMDEEKHIAVVNGVEVLREPPNRGQNVIVEEEKRQAGRPVQDLSDEKLLEDANKLLEDEQAILEMMIEEQHESWKAMQERDEECKQIMKELTEGYPRITEQYRINDAKLEHKTMEGWRTVVPAEARNLIMFLNHNHALAGHQGIQLTLEKIKKDFYWKRMDKDVRRWCSSCICAGSKLRVGIKNGRAGLFKMWNVFEAIHIDGCEMPLSAKGGFRHMLTVVDRASRLVELIPMRSKSAKDVAKALFERWICRYSAPTVLFCDQDPAYQSILLTELMRNVGGKTITFSPYSHHNGLAEAFNRTACAVIRAMIASEGLGADQWNEILPAVCYVLNTTVNREIGVSAMGYVYGKEPVKLASRRMPQVLQGSSWADILKASLKAIQRVRTAANFRRFTVEVQSVMKRNTEQRRRKTVGYEVDEPVWVWFVEERRRGKVDASAKWRRGVYVRLSHSRRSHWVYVGGRLLKKSDMHVHPRVPTISRCLVGQLVEETNIDTSDESDVEAQIRLKVRKAQSEQDMKMDAQWIEWYNMGSEPITIARNLDMAETEAKVDEVIVLNNDEQPENEDQPAEGERQENNEISEKKRSKKSKKRRPMEERDLPLVKFVILESMENSKIRLLTLRTGSSFHCFTRSKRSVRGRWRYQPTFYCDTDARKCIYSDVKRTNYKKWLLSEEDGWKVADSIHLPFREGEYFSVSETEKAIIEEGREQI